MREGRCEKHITRGNSSQLLPRDSAAVSHEPWTMALSDDHWHGRNVMDSILLTLR